MAKHIHLRIAGLIVAMALALGGSASFTQSASADGGLLGTGIDVQVLEQGGDGGVSDPPASGPESIVDDVVDVVEGESTTIVVTDEDDELLEVTAGLGGEPAGPTCEAVTCGNNVTVGAESISAPAIPSGPTTGTADDTLTYTAGGSSSSPKVRPSCPDRRRERSRWCGRLSAVSSRRASRSPCEIDR